MSITLRDHSAPARTFFQSTRKKLALTLAALSLTGLMSAGQAHAGLVFNFTSSTGNVQADAGFVAAGAIWSSIFSDDVTINVARGFSDLGYGILGATSNSQAAYSYTNTRNALLADQTSLADNVATAHLQTGAGVDMLLNRTANNPNGAGNATPYLDNNGDANNQTIVMSNANAKALGLMAGNNGALDGEISFSSAFSWDFDASDGILAGAFDFVGVALHELGHLLGFVSGVDVLDYNSTSYFFDDYQFTYASTLDLFRYSTQSASIGNGVIDWSADYRDKYFSIDGGATSIASFSTGTIWGDGRQASHWKDNQGNGLLDPTAAPGEFLSISAKDLLALDVIGWNVISNQQVPEPGTLGLLLLGAVALVGRRRKQSGVAH